MGWIIFTVVMVLVFIGALVTFFMARRHDAPRVKLGAGISAGVAIVALVVAALVCTFVQVPTKSFGVQTSFNEPTGKVFGAGLTAKAPWTQIHSMDAAKQPDEFKGEDCINVRMARQAKACVDIVVTWRLHQPDAATAYQDYKDIDKVRRVLVVNNMQSALGSAFSAYDPLVDIGEGAELDEEAYFADFVPVITAELEKLAGPEIEVISITHPFPNFHPTTQDKIDELQAEVARTGVAEQSKLTAIAQAAAAKELEDLDVKALVNRCLDIWEATSREHGLPWASSCWPGESSGASVAIPTPAAPAKE